MEVSFFNTLQNVHNQVNETTTSIVEHVEDENLKIEYLKQLEMVLDSCIKCKHKVTILCQAAREATARAQDETTGEPKADLFDELVEESIAELELDAPIKEELEKDPSLKALKKLLKQHTASTSGSEDLVATQYSHSLIDPISKKRMTSPVRNKLCGHVYDRNSVTSMISAKHKNGFRCPTMGCVNRRAMKLSDLEDAPDVKRQLSLHSRRDGM